MQKPSIGRIVHFTLDDAPAPVESDDFDYHAHVRAAVITRVFEQEHGETYCNLHVFLDGDNDKHAQHVYSRYISPAAPVEADDECPAGELEAGQLPHPGHWHWPPRV